LRRGTKTYYVYGLGLLHEETGSTVRYYHCDRRGDTVLLTDASGGVTDRASYGVFGDLVSRSGTTDTPFLFNGCYGVQTDANGLYYLRARYYHPALRRFLNQDSVLGSIASAMSLNRYAYANGNPVSAVDPFGTMAQDLTPKAWFNGRGFMDAFGRVHPTFCLSCHDNTEAANFNKTQQLLANALDWKIIAYEQILGAGITAGLSSIAEDIATARSLVTVYRVEGAANGRLIIDEAGRVTVTGDNMLFLNFGSRDRAEEFLATRLSQGMSDSQIKEFEVPVSLLDDLRSAAVPESMAQAFPDRPILVDVTKAPDQFGLRQPQMSELQAYIIEINKNK
jgi:RHS repeat-associated protein